MIYEFSPKQDLHGYSKPWAPGTGKNLFNIDAIETYSTGNGSITQNGDGSVTVYFRIGSSAQPTGKKLSELSDVEEEQLITLSAKTTGIDIIYLNNAAISWKFGTSKTITDAMLEGTVYMYADQQVPGSTAIVSEMQMELGSTATAYEPYGNICTPEGYNIWDPSQDKMIQVYAGYVNANTRELYLRPVYEEYAGEELVGPWMSSLDPYEEDTTPTEGAFVIDFGGELTSYEITPFMLQTLLDSLGIRQHFTNGAGLLNSLMDQAQGRVRSEEELLHLSRPLNVIAIGDQLPAGLTFKPISKDVLPGLPGKFIR